MDWASDEHRVWTSAGQGVDGSDAIEIPFRVNAEVPMGPEVDFDYPIDDSPTVIAKQIRDIAPSPNGEDLAFTIMGDLYVMEYPDGEPRRLADMEAMESMQIKLE